MENQADSKKIIINYGLLIAGASILISLTAYATGNIVKPNLLLGIAGFVIPIVLLVLGIKKYKTENGGYLKWSEAVKIGLGISLIWGILTLTFQYVLENHIDPSIMEQKLELVQEQLENFGMDEDLIEESMEKQRTQSPLISISMGILMYLFVGFVISAIAGAVMKKSAEDDY